jgi:hypothetical protein
MALCATVSAVTFILLWAPLVLLPSLKDAEPGSYGEMVAIWTITAIVLVGAALVVSRFWPMRVSAPVTLAFLVTAVGIFLWATMGDDRSGVSALVLPVGVAFLCFPHSYWVGCLAIPSGLDELTMCFNNRLAGTNG